MHLRLILQKINPPHDVRGVQSCAVSRRLHFWRRALPLVLTLVLFFVPFFSVDYEAFVFASTIPQGLYKVLAVLKTPADVTGGFAAVSAAGFFWIQKDQNYL